MIKRPLQFPPAARISSGFLAVLGNFIVFGVDYTTPQRGIHHGRDTGEGLCRRGGVQVAAASFLQARRRVFLHREGEATG